MRIHACTCNVMYLFINNIPGRNSLGHASLQLCSSPLEVFPSISRSLPTAETRFYCPCGMHATPKNNAEKVLQCVHMNVLFFEMD